MPLALKTIELEESSCINLDDTGILVQSKYKGRSKSPQPLASGWDVVFWLNGFADDYWKLKNPEIEENAPEEVPEKEISEETLKNGEITNSDESEEKKDADKKEDTETKPAPQSPPKKMNSTPIKFVERDINVENHSIVFVASNLEDPGDYLHYIFDQMARGNVVDKNRMTKFPLRAMPIHGLCLAKPREMEELSTTLADRLFNDDQVHRFSVQFYGSMDGEHMTQREASAILRNCIWAANPNCVQCVKYPEVSFFTIDIIKPFFCIGYLYDYVKLRRYMTYNMKQGYDLCGEEEDSEDDISDDPTLDWEDEKKRKLRIKRKRNAEKAQLAGAGDGSNCKVVAEGEEAAEDDKLDLPSADDKNGLKEEITTNGEWR